VCCPDYRNSNLLFLLIINTQNTRKFGRGGLEGSCHKLELRAGLVRLWHVPESEGQAC